jgi:hypothetical protein
VTSFVFPPSTSRKSVMPVDRLINWSVDIVTADVATPVVKILP